MCAAAVKCVPDCIADGIRPVIPQPAEWQRIGDQINTAMIFAGAYFVNVDGHGLKRQRLRAFRAAPSKILLPVLRSTLIF